MPLHAYTRRWKLAHYSPPVFGFFLLEKDGNFLPLGYSLTRIALLFQEISRGSLDKYKDVIGDGMLLRSQMEYGWTSRDLGDRSNRSNE